MPDTKPIFWKQGEHVILVGDTGSGKTYLESKLLPLRKHVIVLRTKPDDIKFTDFRKVTSVFKIGAFPFNNAGQEITKYLLVPKYEDQRREAARLFETAWLEGGWTVAVDETYYATNILKLESYINKLLTQGRSKRITVVAGMQRPAWVSRFALSQCTHAFIFRMEGRDLTALSQALSPAIVEPVANLTGHDFIYFNRATREIRKGNARNLSAIFRS